MNITLEEVEQLRIRDRSVGNILGVCSVCGCSDASYSLNLGVWRCWHCPSSGRIIDPTGKYQFKPRPVIKKDVTNIRNFFDKMSKIYHKALTPTVIDYLVKRGLTEETIEKYRLGFCSLDKWEDDYDKPIAAESGLVKDYHLIMGNRITIPYFYGGKVVDIRGRIASEFQTQNTTPYLSLYGSYNDRGAIYFYNHDVISKSDRVILTEGEFKALAAAQYGYPVVATPGYLHWLDWWGEALQGKKVVLAYDNEDKDFPPSLEQAIRLQKIFPKARVAALYRPSKCDKMDIDSFILAYGADAFGDTVKGAIPVARYVRILLSYATFKGAT